MGAWTTEQTTNRRRSLVQAIGAYAGFCGLGLLSRFVPSMFSLFVLYGLAFPLLWAIVTRSWREIGFTRQGFGKASLWGVLAGVAWGIYTYLVFRASAALPPLWGLQVAMAIPIWFLVMSPFQEFFYRGWLQPRFESSFGKLAGLIITSLLFTAWHFFPQFEGTLTATLPLSSPIGILSTFLAGLLFGAIYQRNENITAPWFAHAIGGIALVLIGRMTFVQYVP